MEYQTNFGHTIIATKRTAEALPAAQTDIPRERVMLKFKDEDAEAVMAKAPEGGRDSEKEEPMPIPALLESTVEAQRRSSDHQMFQASCR